MNQYREGKVKSTLAKGVKQHLKPHAYKQFEDGSRKARLRAYLLHNEPASYLFAARLSRRRRSRSESESEQGE